MAREGRPFVEFELHGQDCQKEYDAHLDSFDNLSVDILNYIEENRRAPTCVGELHLHMNRLLEETKGK